MKKIKQQNRKNRAQITGDDVKDIFKKNCIVTNQVLELKEILSQVCEQHINVVQELCDKKIERITLESDLAAEEQLYTRLKKQVDQLNKPIQQSDLIEFDEHESTSLNNHGTSP